MSSHAWARLRDLRYALPGKVGGWLPEPDPARLARTIREQGLALTFGYFAADAAPSRAIVAAYSGLADSLRASGADGYLSVKAPQIGFDADAVGRIAANGVELLFDAHGPDQADRTLALALRFTAGCALPARWRRSLGDARGLRDTAIRIRLVKGEWADPQPEAGDLNAAYLELAAELAGRSAPVAVATHDPVLAQRALGLLKAAGTPCELEQLRGLPRRRTMGVAREQQVPVRIYLPQGPGWWPYAINQALARPYLPGWWLNDLTGRVPAAA